MAASTLTIWRLPSLAFAAPQLEAEFASVYGRNSWRASRYLRLVEAVLWATSWNMYQEHRCPRITFFVISAMVCMELGLFLYPSLNRRYLW
ncbi:hypothetical protein WJX73_008772 [Symbiochloris irregularis]|uniref:Uncharacterized protein n=1 Tax=Symbiochloris irregularis TaxID=706552 RepID=A0AAW1Q1K0_9CHLO